MRATTLRHASLAIPFRAAFSHASATRERAENIFVEIVDPGGHRGLGEGCPRSYVTGETVETARAFIKRHRAALLADCSGIAVLREWLAAEADDIDGNPSAACAVELAYLDLFARQAGQPVETLLGLSAPSRLWATAVYGSSRALVFWLQYLRFRMNGMTEAKLKLSGDARRDAARARALARRGPVRADANNLWRDAPAAAAALEPVAPFLWAIEEPVQPRDWDALGEAGRRLDLAVVLDESFAGPADLDRLQPGPRYIANLRVSRLGGLHRSLAALEAARTRGVALVVGAHVGETSVLARAGLALAGEAGGALWAYEGSYGTHLLRYDAVAPSLRFGRGGELAPGREWAPDAPGWGLSPGPELRTALEEGEDG